MLLAYSLVAYTGFRLNDLLFKVQALQDCLTMLKGLFSSLGKGPQSNPENFAIFKCLPI